MVPPSPRRTSRWRATSLLLLCVATATAVPAAAVPATPPVGLSPLFSNTVAVMTNPTVSASVQQIANSLVAVPSENLVAPAPNPCAENQDERLIKISISAQHAWMCEQSTLVHEAPATTGSADLGMDTPSGTWHVISKESDRFLAGDDYYLHVDYWLQYDGDFGIHDSAWQEIAYGSPDYRTRGSHGCVHLPADAMAWTYEWSQL